MLPKKLKTVFIVLLFLISNGLISQTDYLVGHIGLKDGLSSQLCSHLLEDNKGNLWISTYQDVQKYDGYSVTVFPQPNLGKKTLSITDLFIDATGNVWVVQGKPLHDIDSFNFNNFFTDCQVHVIDTNTDSIYSMQDYIGSHKYGSLDIVKVFSKGTTLFLCTSDNRIFKYDISLVLHATIKDIKKMVAASEHEDIIYLDQGGLNILDSNSNTNLLLASDILENYNGIIGSQKGELFFIEEQVDSVSLYEYRNSQIQFISTLEKGIFSHLGSKPTKIERYGPNMILIWNRLFELKEGGEVIEVKLAKTKRLISEYIVSKTGLGYAATDLGVYILNTNRNKFLKLASNKDSLNSVRAIYSDPQVSLYKDGIEKIKGHSAKYNFGYLDNHDLGYLAYHHYKDPINENHFWTVGLLDGCYIRKIDLANEKADCIDVIHSSTYTPHQLLRSSKSKILYVSNSGRPYYLDESIEKFQYVDLDCLEDSNMLTTHIIEKNGQIWFAAAEGIIQYDEDGQTCVLKKIFPDSESCIIQYMHEDKINSDIVWLGTRRGGLLKWDIVTDSIQIFNTDNGLSNNDVHAIVEDNLERLWIPTNKYLNTFDKKSDTFFHFTEADGITHSEFNMYSYFQNTQSNQVYFGGLNGYIHFNPDSISTTYNNQIQLRIIAVKKIDRKGETEDVYTETLKTNSISILEKDVSVQIELTSNYLLNPDETKYSYRIPGLLDDWKTEATNVISLNRLPYGNYKIEFISSLNMHSSMSDILSINLDVDVPWWKSKTFFLLTFLGAMGFVWLLFRRYNKNVLDRNIKLEEMVSLRTEELQEVIKTKNKIFAILAHDLRNPISGLSNLSEKVRYLLSKNRLADLNQMAIETEKRVNALNDNLNNILLWALSENNTLKIRPRPLSVRIEIEKVLQLYAHEIEIKKLKINQVYNTNDKVFLDLTILQTLLRNFLHNSLKFSHVGGNINIHLSNKDEKNVELKLKDFGVGMRPLEAKETDTINAEIRHRGKGSGIGIMISEELAEKGGVEFSIDSEIGKGTMITMILPKT